MTLPIQAVKGNLWSRILLFGIIVVLPAVMYFTWLSHRYSGDDLQYAMLVERVTAGKPLYHPVGDHIYEPGYLNQVSTEAMQMPVNPRYLLEYPTSILWVRLWRAVGYTGLAIAPVLALRILVGCAGLLLLGGAIYHMTGKPALAALGGLGIAFSLAYWTYSTHLDQSINMIAIFALVLFLLMRQQRASGYFDSAGIAIPVLMSLASLYNFTAVVISGVISLVITLGDTRQPWKTRVWRFVRYNLIYGGLLAVLLAGAISLSAGPAALLSPEYWASVTFAGHPEYTVSVARDIFRAVIGFEKSQLTFPGAAGAFQAFWDQANGAQKAALLAFYGAAGVIFALPFGYLLAKIARSRRLVRQKAVPMHLPSAGLPVVLLASILLAYSLFNLFWDPGYIKYWTVPLICWWLIAMWVIAEIQNSGARWQQIPVYLAAGLVLLSVSLNLVGIVAAESRFNRNPWLEMAEALKASPENALFVSNGSGLDFYVAYFTRRNVISLDLIQYANGGSAAAAAEVLQAQVNAHLQDGGPIYLFGFDQPDDGWVEQTVELAGGRGVEPAWEFDELTVYQVVR